MTIFGRKLVRADRYADLLRRENDHFDLAFVQAMPADHRARCLDLLDQSRSQLRQDLFALTMLGFPRDGFFVEFGATDGLSLNNTVLMEAEFGWSGILAEPARTWHDALQTNRSAAIDTRCVWRVSGETMRFTEAPNKEHSGVSHLVKPRRRLRGTSYDVTTVSLNDLLDEHQAPAVIDYMSVDTEGSEFEILSQVDFTRWTFKTLTIEHNFAPQRTDIHQLLTQNGYRRVFEKISRFDDWYVPEA